MPTFTERLCPMCESSRSTEGLCPKCKSIRMPVKDDRDAWKEWKFVHHSLAEIRESARSGCPLCYCMATSSQLHRKTDAMAFGKPQDFEQHIRIRLQTREAERSDEAEYLLGIQLGTPLDPANGLWAYGKPEKFLGVSTWSPGPEYDNAGASDSYYMSSEKYGGFSSDRMTPRDCLATCVEAHKMACSSKADRSSLPGRLIDVGSEGQKLRLIDISKDGRWSTSPNKDTKYAALSYCWGNSNAFTTSSKNLEDLQMNGFAIKSLPSTLRDAVRLTRDLHIPFLWVDALCIIQGDDEIAKEDKKVQIRIMADIYANAHLTIEATDACHANGGLFPKGRIVVHSTVDESYMVVASLSPDDWTRDENHYAQQPINRRAWTLQEHLLSRRVLSFTRNGVEWLCHVDLPGQTARENFPPGPYGRLTIGNQSSSKLDDWTKIVENFSSRDVTLASDRLPALSALARTYSTEQDKYLAGLWEIDICKYLLWYRSPAAESQSFRPKFSGVWRDPKIPSWSWASVSVRVCYASDWKEKPTGSTTLMLLSSNLNLEDDQNPFGAVLSGGYLELNGPILRGTLSRYSRNSAEWQPDGSKQILCSYLDENGEQVRTLLPEGSQAWLLVVFDSAEDKRLVGILLRPLEHKEGKQEYARIGILFSKNTLQAGSVKRQTVVVR